MAIWQPQQDIKRLADELYALDRIWVMPPENVFGGQFKELPQEMRDRLYYAMHAEMQRGRKAEAKRLRRLIRYRLNKLSDT